MITVEDVLAKMMRVPKRGAGTLVFDIDAFLRPNSLERQRATKIMMSKVPPEAYPYLSYLSTNYHKGKWRHSFMVHNKHWFGLKRGSYHIPCLLDERRLPTISINVKYHDPHQDCNYLQVASVCRRTGSVEVCNILRARRGGFDEEDVVLEIADETERLH